MSEKQLYRNAVRSKNLIKSAFMQLMGEKDVLRIRVKEILQLADISKGTFYAHYSNIYDVLDEIENEKIGQLIEFIRTQQREELLNDFLPLIQQLFYQMQENLSFFEMLFRSKNAGNLVLKFQKAVIGYLLEEKDAVIKIRRGTESAMFFSFVLTGAVNLLQEWFMKQYPVSLDELAKSINSFILHGIAAIRK